MAMGVGALVATSLITSAVGVGFNMYSSGEAAKIRERQIRLQQTALRLQETESSIENMENLERVLARQEVMSGTRNIAPNSGSLAALSNETFTQFDRINDINKLNYSTKRAGLANASLANSLEHRNNTVKAGLGFIQDSANLGFKYKSLLDFQDLKGRSASVAPQGAF